MQLCNIAGLEKELSRAQAKFKFLESDREKERAAKSSAAKRSPSVGGSSQTKRRQRQDSGSSSAAETSPMLHGRMTRAQSRNSAENSPASVQSNNSGSSRPADNDSVILLSGGSQKRKHVEPVASASTSATGPTAKVICRRSELAKTLPNNPFKSKTVVLQPPTLVSFCK